MDKLPDLEHGIESVPTLNGIFDRIPEGVTNRNIANPKAPYHCVRFRNQVRVYSGDEKNTLRVYLNKETQEFNVNLGAEGSLNEELRSRHGLERIDYWLRTYVGV